MSRISENVWSRLRNDRLQGDTLWARRAAVDLTESLLAALDANETRHLLVPLTSSDKDIHDSQSRGLSVITRELSVRGHEAGRYIDIACLDAAGHDAFDLIGGELADRLASGKETSGECVTRVLSKWRRFWGQAPKNILSKEVQLGLFAELWFLSVWLIPKRGTSDAIKSWRGPFGSRHDFEWTRRSVEVKATVSTRGPIHRINGINQLDPPEEGDLLLFSMRLREEAGATNTLCSLVSTCRALLQEESAVLEQFDLALVQAGYFSEHEEEYEKLRLRIIEEKLFEVRDDFPRLTIKRLSAGIPSGVEQITYDINLSGFDNLCIARRANELLTL
jgi:hypothetical protein